MNGPPAPARFIDVLRQSRSLQVLLGAGIALRLVSVFFQSQMPIEPDAEGVLELARRFSIAEPWAASEREPLWVGLVKAVSGPFDYQPWALRGFTTVLSIGALLLASWLFHEHLRPTAAMLATAIVSLHGFLVLNAARGLREEAVTIIVLAGAAVLLGRSTATSRGLALAGLIGAVAVVRWEISLLAGVLVLIASIARLVPTWTVPAAAVLVGLSAGPWLHSNATDLDDPLAHSNQAALFWYRAERFGPSGVDGSMQAFAGPDHVTWTEFYVHQLGLGESTRRLVLGSAGLTADAYGTALWPLQQGWVDNQTTSPVITAASSAAVAVRTIFGSLVALLTAVGLFRTRPWPRLVLFSTLIALPGLASYGALHGLPYFEPRFVMFVVPFLAAVTAFVVDASFVNRRATAEPLGGVER